MQPAIFGARQPCPYISNYDLRVEQLTSAKQLKLELDNNRAIKAGTYIPGPMVHNTILPEMPVKHLTTSIIL
jgi:hypothetical protein